MDLAAKRRRARERKSTQERMLAEFERQREEYVADRKHRSEYQESKATSRKLSKYFNDKMVCFVVFGFLPTRFEF
mgnify:FL=1